MYNIIYIGITFFTTMMTIFNDLIIIWSKRQQRTITFPYNYIVTLPTH